MSVFTQVVTDVESGVSDIASAFLGAIGAGLTIGTSIISAQCTKEGLRTIVEKSFMDREDFGVFPALLFPTEGRTGLAGGYNDVNRAMGSGILVKVNDTPVRGPNKEFFVYVGYIPPSFSEASEYVVDQGGKEVSHTVKGDDKGILRSSAGKFGVLPLGPVIFHRPFQGPPEPVGGINLAQLTSAYPVAAVTSQPRVIQTLQVGGINPRNIYRISGGHSYIRYVVKSSLMATSNYAPFAVPGIIITPGASDIIHAVSRYLTGIPQSPSLVLSAEAIAPSGETNGFKAVYDPNSSLFTGSPLFSAVAPDGQCTRDLRLMGFTGLPYATSSLLNGFNLVQPPASYSRADLQGWADQMGTGALASRAMDYLDVIASAMALMQGREEPMEAYLNAIPFLGEAVERGAQYIADMYNSFLQGTRSPDQGSGDEAYREVSLAYERAQEVMLTMRPEEDAGPEDEKED